MAYHPKYSDRAIVFDLDQDPQILLDLSVQEIQNLLFVKQKDLLEGQERVQIKELTFNKSPMFVASQNPPKHLGITVEKCLNHLKLIQDNHALIASKMIELYKGEDFAPSKDVDQAIYEGFIQNQDRKKLDKILAFNATQLADYQTNFLDARLSPLLMHYKGRNFLQSLTEQESEAWFEVVQNRLQTGLNGYLSLEVYFQTITTLSEHYPEKQKLWQSLTQYGHSLS